MDRKIHPGVKVAIIVLAVLLAISLIVLAGTFIHNKLTEDQQSTVIIPDNVINKVEEDNIASRSGTYSNSSESKTAVSLFLNSENQEHNVAFEVTNMFPGDNETKYFCIGVSYKDVVTVNFRADVRPGYEKLAEVLKCRIVLLSTGEVMYQGLMKDMPESVDHILTSSESTTENLYYEISVSLDTSVGNEYQMQELVADFHWWVEGGGNLQPPETGDDSNIELWSALAVGSLLILILLIVKNRREEADEE